MFKGSWMAMMAGLWLALAAGPGLQAGTADQEALRSAAREFLESYQQSKNLRDVFKSIRNLSPRDFQTLKSITDTEAPLLPMTWDDRTRSFIIAGSVRLQVVDWRKHIYAVNGKKFRLGPKLRLEEQFQRLLAARKTAFENLLDVFFPTAEARSDDGLFDFWRNPQGLFGNTELQGSTALSSPSYALYLAKTLGFKVSTTVMKGSAAAGAAFMAANYMVTKAEALLAPSCDKQVAQIKEILRKNKIALRSLDCSWHIRMTDRSISFWTADQEEPQSYFVDWNTAVAWQERRAYFFDATKLQKVHELKKNPDWLSGDDSLHRHVIKPGQPEFDELKKGIEPFRQVLEVMGNHRSCYKCEDDIKKALVQERKPTELGGSRAAPPPPRAGGVR